VCHRGVLTHSQARRRPQDHPDCDAGRDRRGAWRCTARDRTATRGQARRCGGYRRSVISQPMKSGTCHGPDAGSYVLSVAYNTPIFGDPPRNLPPIGSVRITAPLRTRFQICPVTGARPRQVLSANPPVASRGNRAESW